MNATVLQALVSFFATLLFIKVLARCAPSLGLVDTPDHRKQHRGQIPVVGGVAILATLVICSLLWQGGSDPALGTLGDRIWVFLAAALALTALGVVDDARGVGVGLRTVVELLISFWVIESLDLVPRNLGDLFGMGHIYMPDYIAYPFTVVAIYGVTNAYNMLDGIDGLLAITVIITIVAFHAFSGIAPGFIVAVVSAALAAFLVSNLSLIPWVPKVFLGDAGSKLLGFIVVSLILTVTSSQVAGKRYIEPVTSLYLVTLPLYDMVFTTLRRVVNGRSPFHADRTHIHHLLQAFEVGHRPALAIICMASTLPALIGMMLDRSAIAAAYQFYIFLGMFFAYCLLMTQAWRVAGRYEAYRADAASRGL